MNLAPDGVIDLDDNGWVPLGIDQHGCLARVDEPVARACPNFRV